MSAPDAAPRRRDRRDEAGSGVEQRARESASGSVSVSNHDIAQGDIARLDELFGADKVIETSAASARSAVRPVRRRARRPLASWSLTASMFGLSMSWFMPWALPISLLGAVLATVALFRRWEDRGVAAWGLGLGLAGAASAAFWILWILDQLSVSSL